MNRMTSDSAVYSVLSNYTAFRLGVQANRLGSGGGFSGSTLWRIRTADERDFCLRRWPAEHPSPERLTFIHSVLRAAAAGGLTFVPAPLETDATESFIEHDASLWEVTCWLPGKADFHSHPTAARLRSAMRALAAFHRTTRPDAGYWRPAAPMEVLQGPAPAIVERRDRLRELLSGGLARIAAAADRRRVHAALDALLPFALSIAMPIGQRLLPLLDEAARRPRPLQPAIRDIWHDHVLFTGDEVTGIVDYGALRIDTPLVDIARLVGSLVEDDPTWRKRAFDAYAELQPLADEEHALVDLLDRSSVLLGLVNWAEWLYIDGREFDDLEAVERRVTTLVRRLHAQVG